MTDAPSQEAQLEEQLRTFLQTYRTELYSITRVSTNVFEAICFFLFVRHYERAGFLMQPENLRNERFKFKFSTAGYPWRYSYFTARRSQEGANGRVVFEVRHNQRVIGAWFNQANNDNRPPIFAVDIAIVRQGYIPNYEYMRKPTSERDMWLTNYGLITFGEVKKLVAYPMLLAQFFGEVHEIKPEYVANSGIPLPQDIVGSGHTVPVLFTSGTLTAGSQGVLDSLRSRGHRICIVENVEIAREETLLERIQTGANMISRSEPEPTPDDILRF